MLGVIVGLISMADLWGGQVPLPTLNVGMVQESSSINDKNNAILEGAKQFVKSFYDWYAPEALRNGKNPAWHRALDRDQTLFSVNLAKLLREDIAAQDKYPGEIVGLDFDPFLNTQDPVRKYTVGGVCEKNGCYYVEIHGIKNGKVSKALALKAEVSMIDGKYVFVDFHYPNGKSLVSILNRLRDEREKSLP